MDQQIQYPIGPYNCSRADLNRILGQFPPLRTIADAVKIKGPFDGKINSIYRIDRATGDSVIFRTRISRAFRYEPIVKEKILYPFLNGTLRSDTPDLELRMREILTRLEGSYQFTADHPPIVPVQDLLYYYEPALNSPIPLDTPCTPQQIYPPAPFPFLLTIKNYLPGRSLYEILQEIPQQAKNGAAIRTAMETLGQTLARLHSIRFDAFYDKITEIGIPSKRLAWRELFEGQWRANLRDAAQYRAFQPFISGIEKFYRTHKDLVGEETEPVLFHNDYQSQNVLFEVDPDRSWDAEHKLTLTGVIDFDNWRIGPRAQDFVKIEYWTIQDNSAWLDAFYRGYHAIHPITKDLKAQIQIYKLLWFMLVYAFEMDKVKKQEVNATVDARFPAAEKYLPEIQKIIADYC